MEWLLLLLVGLAAGIIGSLVGLGGGIVIVPSLLLLSSLFPAYDFITPQIAVGTSLLAIVFTSLSSSLAYRKHGTIDFKSGWLFFAGSGPGGILGAWVNSFLSAESFLLYFGLFMIFISFLLFVQKDNDQANAITRKRSVFERTFTDKNGTEFVYGFHPLAGTFIAFIVGFTSGIFGIGGGSLMVPAMILLFLFPPHVAVATSMFMILLSSLMSAGAHFYFGNIHLLLALWLIPGAWFGGKAGAWLNTKLKGKTIVLVLRIMLILIGIRMVFHSP